jgi:hypothetical protein
MLFDKDNDLQGIVLRVQTIRRPVASMLDYMIGAQGARKDSGLAGRALCEEICDSAIH